MCGLVIPGKWRHRSSGGWARGVCWQNRCAPGAAGSGGWRAGDSDWSENLRTGSRRSVWRSCPGTPSRRRSAARTFWSRVSAEQRKKRSREKKGEQMVKSFCSWLKEVLVKDPWICEKVSGMIWWSWNVIKYLGTWLKSLRTTKGSSEIQNYFLEELC